MITVTFEPHNPKQAELLGKFLPEYIRASDISSTTFSMQMHEEVPAAEEAPAAEEKPAAPKRTRAAKPAPAASSAEATAASSDASGAVATTATETTASPTEGAAAASEAVTLEQVRAKLASLSQAGKAGDVKALIATFGANKLTDIEPAKFGDLLAAAEELA